MATTADSSSSNQHSPREALNSPQFRRKNLPSPWAQVVRGEAESISSATHQSPSSPPPSPPPVMEQTAFSDWSPSKLAPSSSPSPNVPVAAESADSNSNNAAATTPKKPAWNKPSNGVVEVGPVMGAASWPLLSAARASTKSSDSSSKAASDVPASASQGPAMPHSAQKQASNTNPTLGASHTLPGRQRSAKGAGGPSGNNSGSGLVQSCYTQPPPPPPPPQFPVLPIPPRPDPFLREPQRRGANWEPRPVRSFVPQSPTGNDNRHSSRRGNYGSRGDGGYHNNFGIRWDQDHGIFNNSRDIHMQHQRTSPRGRVPIRPAPSGVHTFIPPQHMGPFVNPTGYGQEVLFFSPVPMEPFRRVPVITQSQSSAMLMPDPEFHLQTMLVNQIEYYFSDENLIKDVFLKSNMDNQGWVPISLISSFPRVKSQTNNIQLILDSLRSSALLEVQDDKVRRRNEWMKWVPGGRHSSESSLPSAAGSSSDMPATFQRLTVEEASNPSNNTGAINPHTDEASN